MLKLFTLLMVVIGSSAGAQEADTRIGSFLYHFQKDPMTDVDNSYLYSNNADQSASLTVSCARGQYAQLNIHSYNSIITTIQDIGIIARFDKNAPQTLQIWTQDNTGSGMNVFAPQEYIQAFSKQAYSAKQVVIRVYINRLMAYRDFVFPLQGYFKAVMRLPCARAFGFGKAAAPVKSAPAEGSRRASSSGSGTAGSRGTSVGGEGSR